MAPHAFAVTAFCAYVTISSVTSATKIVLIIISIVGILVIVGFALWPVAKRAFFAPTPSNIPEVLPVSDQPIVPVVDETPPVVEPEIFAENLEIPWEILFLPGGDLLVTERPGQLLRINPDDRRAIPIDGVEHIGEGGLLGAALHPDFEQNNQLYLYLTTQSSEGLINRVERYSLRGTSLADKTTIIDNIPGASFHDGGRIAFGPDRLLYVTTGDAGDEQSAQDTHSLSGKILRLEDDGSVPTDNPFGNAIYSYGHRNPQGLTWDDQNRLWVTEHGPSGFGDNAGQDELNFIEPGNNYGWPTIKGDQSAPGLVSPIVQSGTQETWAPGGAIYLDGSIFFVGLRGETLYEAKIIEGVAGPLVELTAHLRGEYGRLRVVTLGPDGLLYIATSNTDGRGGERQGDDKIIRFSPSFLP